MVDNLYTPVTYQCNISKDMCQVHACNLLTIFIVFLVALAHRISRARHMHRIVMWLDSRSAPLTRYSYCSRDLAAQSKSNLNGTCVSFVVPGRNARKVEGGARPVRMRKAVAWI